MTDRGEADEKIIGVPTDRLDPAWSGVQGIEDLPAVERQRIEAFFRIYKDLPAGEAAVELQGFGSAAEARERIMEAMQGFERRAGG